MQKSSDFALTPIEAVRILPVGAAFGRVRFADVAQLAEQLFCKQQVAGSIPVVGSPQESPSSRGISLVRLNALKPLHRGVDPHLDPHWSVVVPVVSVAGMIA